MGMTDSVKSLLKLAVQVTGAMERIEKLANDMVDGFEKQERENQRLRDEIRQLQRQVDKMENYFEFAMKTGMLRVPNLPNDSNPS